MITDESLKASEGLSEAGCLAPGSGDDFQAGLEPFSVIAAELEKGQTVSFRCRCDGLLACPGAGPFWAVPDSLRELCFTHCRLTIWA